MNRIDLDTAVLASLQWYPIRKLRYNIQLLGDLVCDKSSFTWTKWPQRLPDARVQARHGE